MVGHFARIFFWNQTWKLNKIKKAVVIICNDKIVTRHASGIVLLATVHLDAAPLNFKFR